MVSAFENVIRVFWVMSQRTKYLLYALLGALGVFVYSQWSALTNQYVIMDDVRQQTYWMQKWRDPELVSKRSVDGICAKLRVMGRPGNLCVDRSFH